MYVPGPPNRNSNQTSINSLLLLSTVWPIATARLTGGPAARYAWLRICCLPWRMGASKNRATPKWMVYNGKTQLKWMIWGENPPFYRKHPKKKIMPLRWWNASVRPSFTITSKTRKRKSHFQERYNTPLEHTPGNPPGQLWKESLYGLLVKVRGVFQRCVETTSDHCIVHHSWSKGIWPKNKIAHQTTFWGLRSWNRVRKWKADGSKHDDGFPKQIDPTHKLDPQQVINQIEFHAPKREGTTKTLPLRAEFMFGVSFTKNPRGRDGRVLFQGHFSTQGALVYKSSSKVLRMETNRSKKVSIGRFMAQVWVTYHSIHTHDKRVGGWTNPSEKHSSKLDHFPNFRGEKKIQIFETTTQMMLLTEIIDWICFFFTKMIW